MLVYLKQALMREMLIAENEQRRLNVQDLATAVTNGARTIFRPAFSNWRTRQEDIDEFVTVIRRLGAHVIGASL